MADVERKIILLEDGWAFMQKGITKLKNILEGRPETQFTSEEFMAYYTMSHNMCWQKPPHRCEKELYQKYRESIEEYLTSEVLPSLLEKNGVFMLREVVQRWSNHKVMVRWLSKFFNTLDRWYTYSNRLAPVKEAGLTCFRELIYEKFKGQIKDAVIASMREQSKGGNIDSALLKNILDIFVEIGFGSMECYECDFERLFLEDTEYHYSSNAENWIAESVIKKAESSSPDFNNIRADFYMTKVEDYLRRQEEINRYYLYRSTEQKFLETIRSKLVTQHANRLLESDHSGCFALLRDDKVDDLCRMYRLFSKCNCDLKPFSKKFEEHLITVGTTLVQKVEDSFQNNKPEERDMVDVQVDFVGKIIELHQKYDQYVYECFQRHPLFLKALKKAFEKFCNKGLSGISSAQIFSTFCDYYLKKHCGDEVIADALEQVVTILEYISDNKDLFARFYRDNLARRLLFDKTVPHEHERSILGMLRQQFGVQFTSNMDGMVVDLGLASDDQTAFKDSISLNPDTNPGIDLTVTVLTTGFWPSYTSFNMKNIPAEMEKCVEVFNAFYQTRQKNRKLTWIYSLGTCNIEAKFEAKSIELIVAPCQAALLLLFNTKDTLSYGEIVEELNLSDAKDVDPLLHSVSCGKYMILNKEPANKCISSKDVFKFNSKFTDRKRRIKVPLPRADDRKKVSEDDVNKDRKYAIDASIVRIMKTRKVMRHKQLVTECVEQLSRIFKPDVKAIKKQIDSLIQREYMERDEHNADIYKYVA